MKHFLARDFGAEKAGTGVSSSLLPTESVEGSGSGRLARAVFQRSIFSAITLSTAESADNVENRVEENFPISKLKSNLNLEQFFLELRSSDSDRYKSVLVNNGPLC